MMTTPPPRMCTRNKLKGLLEKTTTKKKRRNFGRSLLPGQSASIKEEERLIYFFFSVQSCCCCCFGALFWREEVIYRNVGASGVALLQFPHPEGGEIKQWKIPMLKISNDSNNNNKNGESIIHSKSSVISPKKRNREEFPSYFCCFSLHGMTIGWWVLNRLQFSSHWPRGAIVINIHHLMDVPTPPDSRCKAQRHRERKRDSSMQSISVSIDRLGSATTRKTNQTSQTDGRKFI